MFNPIWRIISTTQGVTGRGDQCELDPGKAALRAGIYECGGTDSCPPAPTQENKVDRSDRVPVSHEPD
ncbi:unnamed protein product [Echinostoma caproni]|uniref:Lipoprotein n=1 Tax=Echinostoma caproni TaxID=27848 RepID=A0A183A7A0_9TREM|nr:unnamed protein product [Echinostoma caproni]